MKKQEEIRTILSSRFDREMLTVLLQVDKVDLDLLLKECTIPMILLELQTTSKFLML